MTKVRVFGESQKTEGEKIKVTHHVLNNGNAIKNNDVDLSIYSLIWVFKLQYPVSASGREFDCIVEAENGCVFFAKFNDGIV